MLNSRVPLRLDLREQAWFDVADQILTRAREVGDEDRDLAALHDVISKTPAGWGFPSALT